MCFLYKDKSVDLRQIGREFNVRYVLEGSVQRVGARMRVNVQLIEAESGAHLWAERFDKPIADLFEMQDEIVSRIGNQLGHELAHVEAGWAERSAKPDSMDHYFLGLAFLNKGFTAEFLDRARSHFDTHSISIRTTSTRCSRARGSGAWRRRLPSSNRSLAWASCKAVSGLRSAACPAKSEAG
jgi:hypothetical protein